MMVRGPWSTRRQMLAGARAAELKKAVEVDAARPGGRSLSRRAAVAVVLAAALVALPADASGAILRATSSLPPGESGYVSLLGVSNGTGRPTLRPAIAVHRLPAQERDVLAARRDA